MIFHWKRLLEIDPLVYLKNKIRLPFTDCLFSLEPHPTRFLNPPKPSTGRSSKQIGLFCFSLIPTVLQCKSLCHSSFGMSSCFICKLQFVGATGHRCTIKKIKCGRVNCLNVICLKCHPTMRITDIHLSCRWRRTILPSIISASNAGQGTGKTWLLQKLTRLYTKTIRNFDDDV